VQKSIQQGSRPAAKPGFIYAIRMGDLPFVKIGFAEDIGKRLATLKTSSPLEYKLLAQMRGTLLVERGLHFALESSRERGEWFRFDERVASVVQKFGDAFSSEMDDHLFRRGVHWMNPDTPAAKAAVAEFLSTP
jgi:hypothetical protein